MTTSDRTADLDAPDGWCGTCGSRHGRAARCPGPLIPTGEERDALSQAVRTERGVEVVSIRVVPCDDLWVARIVTLPRTVWVIPGGNLPRKFVARSVEAAVAAARDHFRRIADARRWRPAGPQELASFSGLLARREEAAVKLSPAEAERRERRRTACDLPVSFSFADQRFPGRLSNVSERGVFVHTFSPPAAGTALQLQVRLPDGTLPLRGTVVWSRVTEEPDRPAGMGVRLHGAPALYRHFVRGLSDD